MICEDRVLAVIPARGGSKRIPNKNLVSISGKTLLQRTIECAVGVREIDRTIVSTDCPTIRSAALSYGAEVPFIRPSNLSCDVTPGIAPILHAISEVPNFDTVIVLQVTSPFRTSNDVSAALDTFREKKADSVISVCESQHHPNWMKSVNCSGRLVSFTDSTVVPRSQDLPPVYAMNGAIYVVKSSVLQKRKTWHVENCFPYIMPRSRSVDIDTEFDLRLARIMAKDSEGSGECTTGTDSRTNE